LFCYGDDLVAAFLFQIDTGDDSIGLINLGSSGEFAMLKLAETVIDISN